jgi:hypothetical protein
VPQQRRQIVERDDHADVVDRRVGDGADGDVGDRRAAEQPHVAGRRDGDRLVRDISAPVTVGNLRTMKVPWKIVGLAGVAGVTAATGVVVARKRREHTEYDPDELRDRLHARVADAAGRPLPAVQTPGRLSSAPSQASRRSRHRPVHTAPHGDPGQSRTKTRRPTRPPRQPLSVRSTPPGAS